MTRTAAVQHADARIRVNAVAPGMLRAMRTSRGSADPAWRATQIAGVPMKREGAVEEVADTFLFLACAESSDITGVEILVDGGLTCRASLRIGKHPRQLIAGFVVDLPRRVLSSDVRSSRPTRSASRYPRPSGVGGE
jgi:hypothetical protein